MQEDALRRSLLEVARTLDRVTSNWFLEGGLCLGYLRHGRPIAWDADIDIGIYDPRISLRALAKRLPVSRYYGIGTRVTEAVIQLESNVEIFFFFDHGECVAETLHNLVRREVKLLAYPKGIFEDGVERVTFCGVECNALKRSHEYCRTIYGDSYLIPDPRYDWWEGPVNGVLVTSEPMFVRQTRYDRQDIPEWTIWDKVRRYRRSYGPLATVGQGFRRVGRLLAEAARTMRATKLGRREG